MTQVTATPSPAAIRPRPAAPLIGQRRQTRSAPVAGAGSGQLAFSHGERAPPGT